MDFDIRGKTKVIIQYKKNKGGNKRGNNIFRYELPNLYIKKLNDYQLELPKHSDVLFHSSGYVFRVFDREWSTFPLIDNNKIIEILKKVE